MEVNQRNILLVSSLKQRENFNNFLHLNFKQEEIAKFVTNIKTSMEKNVEIGINLPQEILAHFILFKFPLTLNNIKRQIMH